MTTTDEVLEGLTPPKRFAVVGIQGLTSPLFGCFFCGDNWVMLWFGLKQPPGIVGACGFWGLLGGAKCLCPAQGHLVRATE